MVIVNVDDIGKLIVVVAGWQLLMGPGRYVRAGHMYSAVELVGFAIAIIEWHEVATPVLVRWRQC